MIAVRIFVARMLIQLALRIHPAVKREHNKAIFYT